MSGGLSDKFGRKKLLLVAAFLFASSSVLTGWAPSFSWFVAWRLLGGVAIGMTSIVAPVYIAEVAPARLRGRFVAIYQLAIFIGFVVGQTINYGVNCVGDGIDQRRLAAAPAAAPADQGEFVKRLVAKYGPKYGESKIPDEAVGQFLAAHGKRPENEAVLDFLKSYKVNLLPSYVELARRGLVPWSEARGWRWMFASVAFPALLFLFAMFFVPESPRWLVKNGMSQRALQVLRSLCGAAQAAPQLEDIQQTIAAEEVQRVRFSDLLEPKMRKIVLLGVFLAVLQQWSGLNVLFYYAEEVYRAAGYGVNEILFNIVITGVICLTVNCIAIGTVDRFGRRILMLIGCASIGICHAMLGVAYLMELQGLWVLLITLAAIGLYSMSLAPIVWVLISEIFPNRIRGVAVSVCASSLWIACFILTYTFPLLRRDLGMSGTFWLYGAVCFLGFAVVYWRVPETKGKTLEQIERELVD